MRKLFALVLVFVLASCSYARDDYDVVIAGGGTGGVSAAIQASRMGVDVLIVEPTNMLGGQATAAGVANMDDLSGQQSGIYREFMSRVEEYYAVRGKSIGTSYWDPQNLAFEPSVGAKILADMTRGEDAPDILYRSEIIAVGTDEVISVNGESVIEGRRVSSVIIQTPAGKRNVTCRVLIDATEYGDVIPLTGAKYRAANSISPNIKHDAMIQDITWTAVIRKYPGGIPERLRPRMPLPGYDFARWNYERYVTKNGNSFTGTYPVKLPVNFVTHNAYRGLPDSFTTGSYTSDPENWPLITKTSVNWGNDYPGQYKWNEKYGLPAAYLENKTLRARAERDALIKTLHFIYYMQNELGELWSVDEDEYNELPEAAKDLPDEWKEIARHMPPVPYVRESRRIIGEHVFTSAELYRNSLSYRNNNGNNELTNAIAIGRYPLDLHHAGFDADMEKDLGEKAEYANTHAPVGNFQVPLDILIPKDTDGFIAAEKNLSMSRLAAGALRLQPITMMTGQAAGALAALAVTGNVQPREVSVIRVQKALLDSGVTLSLANYSDVPEGHKYFGAVQLASLHRLLEPVKLPADDEPGIFGVDEAVSVSEAEKLKITFREGMTRGEAVNMAVSKM